MVLKKINAVTALLMTLLLLDHTSSTSILLITDSIEKSNPSIPRFISVLALLHIVISMIMVFGKHETAVIKYKSKNIRTLIQRDSGVLLTLTLPFHIVGGISAGRGELTLLFLISHLLLTVFSMVHLAVSFPNAFVSLGIITKQKTHKILLVISIVVAILLTVLAAVATVMGVMSL